MWFVVEFFLIFYHELFEVNYALPKRLVDEINAPKTMR